MFSVVIGELILATSRRHDGWIRKLTYTLRCMD